VPEKGDRSFFAVKKKRKAGQTIKLPLLKARYQGGRGGHNEVNFEGFDRKFFKISKSRGGIRAAMIREGSSEKSCQEEGQSGRPRNGGESGPKGASVIHSRVYGLWVKNGPLKSV